MTDLLLLFLAISVVGYARIAYLAHTGRITRWTTWRELGLEDLWIVRITLVSNLGFVATLITAVLLK
jgi:hypothetical protein